MITLNKVYLAIPYTKMEKSSYIQSINATVFFMNMFKNEINIYSPIVHSHPLATMGLRGDWDYWKHIDYQYIDWCNEVWVLIPQEGIEKVDNSTGVQAEIEYAKETGKIIKYMTEVGYNNFKEVKIEDMRKKNE